MGSGRGAGAQILLVAVGLTAAVLATPTRGIMVAVSLTGAGATDTINLALAHGATIEGMGRFAGSVILKGDRTRLAAVLRAHGVLLLAAPSGLCGG